MSGSVVASQAKASALAVNVQLAVCRVTSCQYDAWQRPEGSLRTEPEWRRREAMGRSPPRGRSRRRWKKAWEEAPRRPPGRQSLEPEPGSIARPDSTPNTTK